MLAAIHCCQLAIQTVEDTEMSLMFAIYWHFIRQLYDLLAMCEYYKTEKDIVWLTGKRMKLVCCCNSYVMFISVPAVQFPQQ
jgi:hypothetical protein